MAKADASRGSPWRCRARRRCWPQKRLPRGGRLPASPRTPLPRLRGVGWDHACPALSGAGRLPGRSRCGCQPGEGGAHGSTARCPGVPRPRRGDTPTLADGGGLSPGRRRPRHPSGAERCVNGPRFGSRNAVTPNRSIRGPPAPAVPSGDPAMAKDKGSQPPKTGLDHRWATNAARRGSLGSPRGWGGGPVPCRLRPPQPFPRRGETSEAAPGLGEGGTAGHGGARFQRTSLLRAGRTVVTTLIVIITVVIPILPVAPPRSNEQV